MSSHGSVAPTTAGAIAAPQPGSDAGSASDQALQPITDAQGRVFYPRVDPSTGHTLYEHQSQQTAANGNRVQLAITIDLSQDGSYARTVDQRLDTTTGDFQQEREISRYSNAGIQVGDEVTGHSKVAGRETFEQTASEFTQGAEVRRNTDLRVLEESHDATGAAANGETTIHASWDNGGQPLTAETIPVLDRHELVRYSAPGLGINKDTDRVITTRRHAVGPMNALTYPEPMSLVVRFNGHDGQYIEREMSVPLDAAGAADFAHATTTRTDDHQSGLVKGLMQARIWGGFASSWLGVLGVRLLGTNHGLARGMMYAGLAAGAAEGVGEVHALATKRNDGSTGRLFMSLYDSAWLGLVTYYTRGGGGGSAVSSRMASMSGITGAGTMLGLGGIGVHGMQVANDVRNGSSLIGGPGSNRGDVNLADQVMPRDRARALAASAWRPEPRFDVQRQLIGA